MKELAEALGIPPLDLFYLLVFLIVMFGIFGFLGWLADLLERWTSPDRRK